MGPIGSASKSKVVWTAPVSTSQVAMARPPQCDLGRSISYCFTKNVRGSFVRRLGLMPGFCCTRNDRKKAPGLSVPRMFVKVNRVSIYRNPKPRGLYLRTSAGGTATSRAAYSATRLSSRSAGTPEPKNEYLFWWVRRVPHWTPH